MVTAATPSRRIRIDPRRHEIRRHEEGDAAEAAAKPGASRSECRRHGNGRGDQQRLYSPRRQALSRALLPRYTMKIRPASGTDFHLYGLRDQLLPVVFSVFPPVFCVFAGRLSATHAFPTL